MLTHKGTQTIETARLTLRRFDMKDADAMLANWASDEEVTRFLTWPPHSSVDVTRRVLQSWVDGYENDDYYQWAIVLKELNEPIGSISVVSHSNEVRKAHIGYCIGRPWWNRGITSEALKAVMDFLFDEVGMNRVEAMHDPNNPYSGAVMRKCGMHFEGTFKQADRNNQGICDASHYALVAQDREEK